MEERRARKKIQTKPSPKKIATEETAIRSAASIVEEIDKKWPTKVPAPSGL